ncbi:hypothetical protein [Natrinema soli]|uniref:Uncharacterized protein n=1 Tax=Natrinema soli TaxID=1930624 RepID=A0ABD5SR72_9EURY|nr:hypothetical protein [Natrinema soli]
MADQFAHVGRVAAAVETLADIRRGIGFGFQPVTLRLTIALPTPVSAGDPTL